MLRRIWPLQRKPKIGELIRFADRARDRGDWSAAAGAYRRIVSARPLETAFWIQLGHAEKELGALDRASEAYAQAIANSPDESDALLQYGHVLKLLGRKSDAIAAFAAASRIDPTLASAVRELASLGARDEVSDATQREMQHRFARDIASAQAHLRELVDEQARLVAMPPRSFERFRADFPVAAPPHVSPSPRARILVHAHGASPAMLRATLSSLQDLAETDWHAVVHAGDAVRRHPVGSFAFVDDRIAFGSSGDPSAPEVDVTLLLDAGTVLNAHAITWLHYGLTQSGCGTSYGDHDIGQNDWRGERRLSSPAMFWAYDPQFLAETSELPAVVAIRSVTPALSALGASGREARRDWLLAAASTGGGVHIPRFLATRLIAPAEAANGLKDLMEDGAHRPIDSVRSGTPEERAIDIAVIIPTRDESELLASCVASLLDKAEDRARIRIIIVDNRSQAPETATLLADGVRSGRFDVLTMDEPFNWSRANNLAAAQSSADILLFLNNDTTMLTEGWDRLLAAALAQQDIGIAGARLLYPDRSVQHGGILLGMQDGLPVHEALGASPEHTGPMGRWIAPHRVAAVTGAFLGVRRDLFATLNGFDEQSFFVAYNDVDFCLRAREAGFAILQESRIELIHAESRTRGRDLTRFQIAWDHDERMTLHQRWGAAMFRDPSVNPGWSPRGTPFDGLREPASSEIRDWIRSAANGAAWRVSRVEPDAETA
jgi:GT2 family glycosyltransferase/tetratricopeptide (TPR) repeat protein